MIDASRPEDHVERRWLVYYYLRFSFLGTPPEPAPRYLVAQYDDRAAADEWAEAVREYAVEENLRWVLSH